MDTIRVTRTDQYGWIIGTTRTPHSDYDMIYDGETDYPIRTLKRSLSPHQFMVDAVQKVHLPEDADPRVDLNQVHDNEEMLWDALYNLCGKFC